MKTKSLLTLGALAVLGALAYNYYKKGKGTGYANASGTGRMSSRCNYCRNSQGNIYSADSTGKCKGADFCVANAI
jgi:uncharacterized membrane protein YebE (DUF533 family)